jgi:hypothetical protein
MILADDGTGASPFAVRALENTCVIARKLKTSKAICVLEDYSIWAVVVGIEFRGRVEAGAIVSHHCSRCGSLDTEHISRPSHTYNSNSK